MPTRKKIPTTKKKRNQSITNSKRHNLTDTRIATASQKSRSVTHIIKSAGKKKISVAFAALAPDSSLPNLDKIEHIVVLMMENRSFDHVLGYLTLENSRTDVDGLTKDMHNSHKGKDYFPKRRTNTSFGNKQDPCHAGSCVAEQLKDNNAGFVSNYAGTHPKDAEVDLVMNYYNGAALPVYDQLVKDSCICDKWFCSVGGATWPNRLYSIAGQSGGRKDNKTIPIYDLPSFVRHLSSGNISWRWYAHRSPATLRLVDSKYRNLFHLKSDHFSFFDKRSDFGGNSFLEDAAQGKLAAVSWIDPDFGDPFTHSHKNENDDHPPVDMTAGQELVLKLYNAVTSGPQWGKTLLVIVYDEHGGLYDHVPPPTAADDRPSFRRYGVRVPAFIISPWVDANTVSHTIFDHTSIIKTILLKFCRRPDGSIPDMGARVANAAHLGVLLSRSTARAAPSGTKLQGLAKALGSARALVQTSALKMSLKMQATGNVEPLQPNDIQLGVKRARERLQKKGLPEGQP